MYGSVQTTAPIIFCLLWGLLLPNTGCLDSFQVPSARKGMQILIKGLHANICATVCGASRVKCRKAWGNPDSGDLNRFQGYFQLGLSYGPENKQGQSQFSGIPFTSLASGPIPVLWTRLMATLFSVEHGQEHMRGGDVELSPHHGSNIVQDSEQFPPHGWHISELPG